MSDPIHARLVKVSTLPDAVIAPDGARGNGPIYDGYSILGHYLVPPTVGLPFQMTRYNSNGVEVYGLYVTSPVTEVTVASDGPITFKTLNSIYKLTTL